MSVEFKEGLHRGAISFHDNVLVGMGDSMHKMSGAIAKGLAELTGDADCMLQRDANPSLAPAASLTPPAVLVVSRDDRP